MQSNWDRAFGKKDKTEPKNKSGTVIEFTKEADVEGNPDYTESKDKTTFLGTGNLMSTETI